MTKFLEDREPTDTSNARRRAARDGNHPTTAKKTPAKKRKAKAKSKS